MLLGFSDPGRLRLHGRRRPPLGRGSTRRGRAGPLAARTVLDAPLGPRPRLDARLPASRLGWGFGGPSSLDLARRIARATAEARDLGVEERPPFPLPATRPPLAQRGGDRPPEPGPEGVAPTAGDPAAAAAPFGVAAVGPRLYQRLQPERPPEERLRPGDLVPLRLPRPARRDPGPQARDQPQPRVPRAARARRLFEAMAEGIAARWS